VAVGAALEIISDADGGAGLVIAPIGWIDATWPFRRWLATLKASSEVAEIILRPGGAVLPTGTATFSAGLVLERRSDDLSPALVVGSPSGTRLELGTIRFAGDLELAANLQNTRLELSLGRSRLVIAGSDGDGFLQQILPPDGLSATFDLNLAWERGRGIHFKGATGMEAALPVHAAVALLTLDTVYLGLYPDGPGLRLSAGVAATARLGPVTVVAQRLGLTTLLSFPPLAGNLGAANVDTFEFKPPDGVGIRIDATTVVGGGFLNHDNAKQQYTGALQLEFVDKFDFRALGFLSTSPGQFSFMAVVFIDGFEPIEIGLGFTLMGVGGVVGMNRISNPDALRAKLRAKTPNPLLFPNDPIGNAPQIIGDLQADFPYAPDRFLFGPMAEIGWGEPTVLTIKLGIILELPAPIRLVLLGELEALLPDKTKKLVEIHLNALGMIDFGRGEASLDAVLHDSKIVGFTLTGAMAFRMSWGATRSLVVSVGGLNPHYQPPTGFPKLDRLAIALSGGSGSDNPTMTLDAYLALTSNTVQFGSHLALRVHLDPFTVDGHLGFDALIHFSPFSFSVDFEGDITLAWGTDVIATISLTVSLSGPHPWKAHAVVTFSIFTVAMDWSSGPDELPEPAADPQLETKLLEALTQVKNWGSRPPDGSRTLVTLRPQIAQDGVVAAHPLGELTVHQRVLPLNVAIDSYGGVPLSRAVTFMIGPDSVQVGGQPVTPLPTTLTDYFATGQYRQLKDSERLSRPSFELYPAGLRFTVSRTSHGVGSDAQLTYLVVVVDSLSPYPSAGSSTYQPTGQDLAAHVGAGSAAQAPAVRSGRAKYAAPRRSLDVGDTEYVIASRTNLVRQPAVDGGHAGTYTQIRDKLSGYMAEDPEATDLQVVARREVMA